MKKSIEIVQEEMKYERTKKEARERKKFEPTRAKYEKHEKYEKEKLIEKENREWYEKRDAYLKAQALRDMKYIMLVYGKDFKTNKRLAKMDSDAWEIHKAREYVANENRNGHECYNAVEGEKLWINRERWKLLRNK